MTMRGAGVDGGEGAFRMRTLIVLLVVGIVGFVGTLVIGAFAPDLRSGRDGGVHALSSAAIGYAGLVRLAEATGRGPVIVRDERRLDDEELLVATPPTGATDMSKLLAARENRPTLVVLPKWDVATDPDRTGWVRRRGLRWDAAMVLAPQYKLRIERRRSGGRALVVAGTPGIRLTAPRPLQVITGSSWTAERGRDGRAAWFGRLHPVVTDGRGGTVLARLDDGPLYVLADPDLLANMGLRRAEQAEAVLALLDRLNVPNADRIDFDVTLNGLGRTRSPLKLLFVPPFLPMTLAIGAVLLLAGLHALARFGPTRAPARAIAFGKAALVDNTAALVRKAGRERRLGGRYAEVVRDRAAAAFRAPVRDRDAYLDRLGGGKRFGELAAAAAAVDDTPTMMRAARALHQWMGETKG